MSNIFPLKLEERDLSYKYRLLIPSPKTLKSLKNKAPVDVLSFRDMFESNESHHKRRDSP